MEVSIVLAVVFVLVMVWSLKVRHEVNARGGCPECGLPMPFLRLPVSLREALWGGWTCRRCASEMDRNGGRLR